MTRPALSAVTPLIAIPAITSTAGARGWEAYALGLSIGSAACVIIELGWPLTGPQRVAAEPRVAAYLASDRRMAFNEDGIFRNYPELDAD